MPAGKDTRFGLAVAAAAATFGGVDCVSRPSADDSLSHNHLMSVSARSELQFACQKIAKELMTRATGVQVETGESGSSRREGEADPTGRRVERDVSGGEAQSERGSGRGLAAPAPSSHEHESERAVSSPFHS